MSTTTTTIIVILAEEKNLTSHSCLRIPVHLRLRAELHSRKEALQRPLCVVFGCVEDDNLKGETNKTLPAPRKLQCEGEQEEL